jgi:hypothetical protein
VTVAVEIGKVGALGPELVRDDRFMEAHQLRLGGLAGADDEQQGEAKEEMLHGLNLPEFPHHIHQLIQLLTGDKVALRPGGVDAQLTQLGSQRLEASLLFSLGRQEPLDGGVQAPVSFLGRLPVGDGGRPRAGILRPRAGD